MGGADAGCDVHGNAECRPQGQVGKGPRNRVGTGHWPWSDSSGVTVVSVRPAAFAAPWSPAQPVAREAPGGSGPQPGPARPRLLHLKYPKTGDDFVPDWQFGPEFLQDRDLKQLSGDPYSLRTPPPFIPATSFLVVFSPSALHHTFPPFCGCWSLWSVARPCSTRHRLLALGGVFILDSKDPLLRGTEVQQASSASVSFNGPQTEFT